MINYVNFRLPNRHVKNLAESASEIIMQSRGGWARDETNKIVL